MRAKLFHSAVLASACILLATTTADAQVLTPTPPAEMVSPAQPAGMWTDATSAPNVSWRSADLNKRLKELDLAGAVGVVGAARSASGQWAGAAGARTLGGQAAAPGDKFRVASITKPMVATVLMQLVQQGLLSLDTRVDSVLPGLLGEHGSQVTLEHLLSHRSGLPDYLTLMALTQQKNPSADFTARARTDKELVALAMSFQVAVHSRDPEQLFQYQLHRGRDAGAEGDRPAHLATGQGARVPAGGDG